MKTLMSKVAIVLMSVVALTKAHAADQAGRISAREFGLKEQTGYLYATQDAANCDPQTDVLYTNFCDSYNNCYPNTLTKCDGSIIGWTEISANGADVVLDDQMNDGSFMIHLNHGLSRLWKRQYINIYVCGDSREADLVKDTRVTASKDFYGTSRMLNDIHTTRSNFKVQIFYNEFALSGKCIGKIEVMP